jgi:hypothetical protein
MLPRLVPAVAVILVFVLVAKLAERSRRRRVGGG